MAHEKLKGFIGGGSRVPPEGWSTMMFTRDTGTIPGS
jgi:hypothetical protein